MKNLTYILDIGSSKISLLACQTNKGRSIILTSINSEYDGFMDGEFFSVEQVTNVISDLIKQIKERLNKPVNNIHIGVPSEFSACVCKRVTRNFVPSKKVTEDELINLFDGVGELKGVEDYIVISFSQLQYVLDGLVTTKLTNQRVSQFVMDCSYILVKKQFIDTMKQIFEANNVSEIDFVSTALSQAQFAREGDNSLQPMIIVDVGHITTSISVSKGEGLMMLSSFSLGGGHITADLMQINNLSFAEADIIKRKVSLTIQSKKDEKYIEYVNGKPIKALINITNDIVKARIENIASVVSRVLDANESFKDLPIYLTGDGVCNFRGVVNIFEAVCQRKVSILKSPLHNGADRYQTSKIGLANIIGKLV